MSQTVFMVKLVKKDTEGEEMLKNAKNCIKMLLKNII